MLHCEHEGRPTLGGDAIDSTHISRQTSVASWEVCFNVIMTLRGGWDFWSVPLNVHRVCWDYNDWINKDVCYSVSSCALSEKPTLIHIRLHIGTTVKNVANVFWPICSQNFTVHACDMFTHLKVRWHVKTQMACWNSDGTLKLRWHVKTQMACWNSDGTLKWQFPFYNYTLGWLWNLDSNH